MDDQRLVLSKYPAPLNFHKCDNAHWKGKGGSRAVTVVKKNGHTTSTNVIFINWLGIKYNFWTAVKYTKFIYSAIWILKQQQKQDSRGYLTQGLRILKIKLTQESLPRESNCLKPDLHTVVAFAGHACDHILQMVSKPSTYRLQIFLVKYEYSKKPVHKNQKIKNLEAWNFRYAPSKQEPPG